MLRRVQIAPSTSDIVHISSTVFCAVKTRSRYDLVGRETLLNQSINQSTVFCNLTVSTPACGRFSYFSDCFEFLVCLVLPPKAIASRDKCSIISKGVISPEGWSRTVYDGQRVSWCLWDASESTNPNAFWLQKRYSGYSQHSTGFQCARQWWSRPRCWRGSVLKLKFHWDQFLVTSSRTCWRRRQLPRNKLATSYEEVGDVARPSWHAEMVWKSSASS